MTQTRTITLTVTHTATSLSGKISAAFQQLLSEIGLREQALRHDWADIETAMRTWLAEKSMKSAMLEVYETSSDRLVTRIDVPVVYSTFDGSVGFRNDLETTRLAARKIAAAVSGNVTFRIVIFNEPWRTTVPGWEPATLRDINDLKRRAMGELARGPGISCGLEYWVR